MRPFALTLAFVLLSTLHANAQEYFADDRWYLVVSDANVRAFVDQETLQRLTPETVGAWLRWVLPSASTAHGMTYDSVAEWSEHDCTNGRVRSWREVAYLGVEQVRDTAWMEGEARWVTPPPGSYYEVVLRALCPLAEHLLRKP